MNTGKATGDKPVLFSHEQATWLQNLLDDAHRKVISGAGNEWNERDWLAGYRHLRDGLTAAMSEAEQYPARLADVLDGRRVEWSLWLEGKGVGIYSYEHGLTMRIIKLTPQETLEMQAAGVMADSLRSRIKLITFYVGG